MKKVYLDNAATTSLDPRVLDAMLPYFSDSYGNPSSSHFAGREARAAVEGARKSIAQNIGAKAARLIFTSGATESNNLVFKFCKKDLGITHVLVSPLEHHAVLYAAKQVFDASISYVQHHKNGELDLINLQNLLVQHPKSLVSIMHANNEIGRINPIQEIAKICKNHQALLHSDTVQSIVHQQINIQELGLDFAVSSAHKYHGPKGVGFLVFGQDFKLTADQWGGTQEKNLRAGTENVASIVGMAKALEITLQELNATELHFLKLKKYLLRLLSTIDGIGFNGESDKLENVLPSILSINLPKKRYNEMVLFAIDMHGIAISGGSACASGAVKGSHVLHYLSEGQENIALRISFSKNTTFQELDYFVKILQEI